jgi:hypothetical protein
MGCLPGLSGVTGLMQLMLQLSRPRRPTWHLATCSPGVRCPPDSSSELRPVLLALPTSALVLEAMWGGGGRGSQELGKGQSWAGGWAGRMGAELQGWGPWSCPTLLGPRVRRENCGCQARPVALRRPLPDVGLPFSKDGQQQEEEPGPCTPHAESSHGAEGHGRSSGDFGCQGSSVKF